MKNKSAARRINDQLEVKDVTSKEMKKLPALYIAFPDGIQDAVRRVEELEEKLHNRGMMVVKPLNVFRIQFSPKEGKTYFQLAIELKGRGIV